MQQIAAAKPQNTNLYQSVPNHAWYTAAFSIVTAVANFFQMIGLWFFGATLWLKGRVVKLPVETPIGLAPIRIFINTIPTRQQAVVPQHASPISPEVDQPIQAIDQATIKERVVPNPELQAITQNIGISWLEIVKALGDVPPQERTNVVKNALLLMKPDMGSVERFQIIQAVAGIPVNEKDLIVALALRAIHPGMDVLSVIEILKSILVSINQATAHIPANERGVVFALAQKVITPNTDVVSMIEILKAIIDVPDPERTEVVNNALLLITQETEDVERTIMIQVVANIPANERAPIIALVLTVINPGMDVLSIIEILKAIMGVPDPERTEVVKNAVLLITRVMEDVERSNIIRAVARMPVSEKNVIVGLVAGIINAGMDAASRIKILEAVTALPAQDRIEVVRNAALLFTPEIGGVERADIIGIIAGIPVSFEKTNVETALALQTITHAQEIDKFSRMEIIKAVIGIPPEERIPMVRSSALLIKPQMGYLDRIETIRIIAGIPLPFHRRDIALALKVAHQHLSIHRVIKILKALLDVQVTARHFIGERVLEIIIPEMYTYERIILIQRLARLPHRQIDAFVRAHRGEQRDDRVAAQQGIDVHAGKRDEQVRAAIELLRQDQGEIPKDRMNQAVQEFTQYLHDHQNAEYKKLAMDALLKPKEDGETFGPLLDKVEFSMLGLPVTGEEVIGRLWIFASGLTGSEQTNAKEGMVAGLKDSYDELVGKVCNQGKTQRLIVSVLQGRLEGVDIELLAKEEVSPEDSSNVFFSVARNREFDTLELLIDAAYQFCDDNPLVNPVDFLRQIRDFAELGQLAEVM